MDMERYGDYTEFEDDQPKKKTAVGTILSVIVAIVCTAVLCVLGLRVLVSGYYPKDMKRLFFNETLTAYYNENGGDIGAKSLEIRYPYDDAEDGKFFAGNLIFIPGANQMQFTVRLNKNVYKELSEKYGIEEDSLKLNFSIKKSVKIGDEDAQIKELDPVPTVKVVDTASFFMYDCFKIVCDDFYWDFKSDKSELLLLEITIDGVDHQLKDEKTGEVKYPAHKITLYWNTEEIDDYSRLKDYKLHRKEHP